MFELRDIVEDGSCMSCIVHCSDRKDFKITIGVVNTAIMVNTSGCWDNIVNWSAGILQILWKRCAIHGVPIPESVVVNDVKEWFNYER